MDFIYEELDFRPTPIGDLMLRRRQMPLLPGVDIYEVKLGEEFLMSSLFHEAEYQLSKLGLAECDGDNLDVVVGGLGLGYTAMSALEDSRVQSLVVIEYLRPVIEWHRHQIVPLGKTLKEDPRCRLIQDDFFACAKDTSKSFDPREPKKLHDAILLDIDHTPHHVLHQTNKRFYTAEGLSEAAAHLKPGGVFALWADGKHEPDFAKHLGSVFAEAKAHTIEFDNPVTGGISCGAVYVAKKAQDSPNPKFQ